MDELIKELHTLWNLSDDPRYKGEHPRCAEILDELYEKFSQIDEETLKEYWILWMSSILKKLQGH